MLITRFEIAPSKQEIWVNRRCEELWAALFICVQRVGRIQEFHTQTFECPVCNSELNDSDRIVVTQIL